jgi:DNA-binding response OmpR family regulator
LLVDPQPAGADSLAPRLKRTGYRTSLARNSQSALQTAHSDPPDLIVLDDRAHEIDGSATCQELKQLRPELPVILYTSPKDQQALCANDCGADEFVVKPADPALVMQKIVQLLRR